MNVSSRPQSRAATVVASAAGARYARDHAEERRREQVEPAHQRRAEGHVLEARQRVRVQHVRVERHWRRCGVQRGRRRRDLRRPPDQDDVEDHEPDEADRDEPVGRERRDPGREREAGAGDQEVTRRLRRQVAVRREPRDEVERSGGRHRPPAEAPAAQHPERGREERRCGRRERGQEVGAARPGPHERDPERERAGREQQPDDRRGAKVPSSAGRERHGALKQAERGVGGR